MAANIEKVWNCMNEPEHIRNWCYASDDWHAPYAENDLRIGGTLKTTMAAKDGSFSFDFEGVYDEIVPHQLISYTLGDGRRVRVTFAEEDNTTKVVQTFDAEDTNSVEMQEMGWQAILDNFKKYTERVK
ncbi:MAG: SRPBCC family protein [Chitinophagaceae bacterium]|nr:SRPBCC family protein [Chitinophagaceae bacterium]